MWKREPGIGANPAVIEAPDGMEQKGHDLNQRLDAEEDREVCLHFWLILFLLAFHSFIV